MRQGGSRPSSTVSRLTRRQIIVQGGAGFAAGALAGSTASIRASAQTPTAQDMAGGVSGPVDIGGRTLYMETRGAGSPTVVLVSGYRASGMVWTDDLIQPDAPRTMVMPAVSEFTNVVAYDRPGTGVALGDNIAISRSDAIAQPRTAGEVVAELHDLLQAAAVPGPYVFAAHSLGGFFVRLYASTYPEEVVGMVLIDAYSERLETLMPPHQYDALKKLNQDLGTDTVVPIPGYGDAETLPWGGENDVMREAAEASPLRQMPLAVLAHGRANALPESSGLTSEELEPLLREANEDLARLVPDARFFVAAESGHDIHQDQPNLVVEAIRQVVTGVRAPDTWYSLTPLSTD